MSDAVESSPNAVFPSPVGAPPVVDFEIVVSRDLARLIAGIELIVKDLAFLKQRHTLLQGQLQVMERQLDHVVVDISKIGVASLPRPALEVATGDMNKAFEELARKQEEELNAIVDARGGDHPPTPEEIAAAQAEALR